MSKNEKPGKGEKFMSTDEENRRGLSRRAFLAGIAATAASGAAVASGAVVAAGALSGCSIAPSGETTTVSGGLSDIPKGFTTFDTDVLVVGAGSAGCAAAISALSAGVNVIMVDKKMFAKCGDSGLHSSGRMTSVEFGIDGDTSEIHLQDATAASQWVIQQDLCEKVLEGYAAEKVLMKSENYGNIHWRDKQGKPIFSKCTSKPRLWEGYKLFNHAYEAVRLGVKIVDYCMITSLLTDEQNAVVGATGIDFHTGEFYVFRAKSTILATGGDCQIFGGSGGLVGKYAGGAYGLTGDGHAMAAPLGVEFRDLEFRSMEIGSPIHPNPMTNFIAVGPFDPIAYPYLDKDGKDIMDGMTYDEFTYRRINYQVAKMVAEGRGGPNGGYFSSLPYIENMSYGVGYGDGPGLEPFGHFIDDWRAMIRQWEAQGMDIKHVEQMPNHCYDWGGIVGNDKAETGVAGLYAAGETSMHCGAGYCVFRMFSSNFVTGKWAGENGADRAKGMGTPPVNWSKVADEYNRVYSILYAEPKSPVRVTKIRDKVQDAAWKGSGHWRSEKKCVAALAELDAVEKEDLPNMYVANKSKVCNMEWFEALETVNMITMARMDTLAAQARKESRGPHNRNEYPDMDNDNWLKNVYIKMANGKLNVELRDTVITKVKPPAGKFPQGGGTLPE